MQDLTTPHIEVWKDEGRDLTMIRCECWRHLIDNGIALNNGWFPYDRPYPHATWCKSRKS